MMMNTEEVFDKIIQHHIFKENRPDPQKEYEDYPDVVNQIDRELDQHFDDIKYVVHIDQLFSDIPGNQLFFITYDITEYSSIFFLVPDDLTIRKMKIDKIVKRLKMQSVFLSFVNKHPISDYKNNNS